MLPDDNSKILVSFDEISDVMADVAVSVTNAVKKHNENLGDFTFNITAIYSAEVTKRLFAKYKVKEENNERTETSGS
jgi:hypothetical protein